MTSTFGSSPDADKAGELGFMKGDLYRIATSQEQCQLDALAEKQAVWKLDLAVIPIVSLFYFLSFLDRSNLGNARVAGLQEGLGLSDHQYSVALTVTYIPYMMAELPANLYLKKIGPHIFLPTIVTIWGIVTTLQGFITSYGGLIATRFFLGLVEGGLFPGIVLYLSTFYTRRELQLRIALFFSTASLSGAFSGLLAYGLIRLDGAGGRPGWAWIFIVEGLFTVLCGVLGYFIIPATPTATRFLSARQKEIILKRLEADQPLTDVDEQFSWWEVWASLKSPHVFFNVVALFASGTSLYSLAYFQPTIINSLGYDSHRTQLMSVPPFAVAFVFVLASAYFSDRFQVRGATTCSGAILGLIGFVMFFRSDPSQTKLKYASSFLSVSGVYSIPPALAAWLSNNSFGHYRKAVSIAVGFVSANAGGILSTWLFPHSEKPKFHKACIINITFSGAIVFFTIMNLCWLRYANVQKRVRRDKLLSDYQLDQSKVDSTESIRAWRELGDLHPDFIYVY